MHQFVDKIVSAYLRKSDLSADQTFLLRSTVEKAFRCIPFMAEADRVAALNGKLQAGAPPGSPLKAATSAEVAALARLQVMRVRGATLFATLTPRTQTCLRSRRIFTLEDLSTNTAAALLTIRGFDDECLTEVKRVLSTVDMILQPEVLRLSDIMPAVPIQESVLPEAIICLSCGAGTQNLKSHIQTHGLTPHGYLTKWGLPSDYPMLPPDIAERQVQKGLNSRLRAAERVLKDHGGESRFAAGNRRAG
jgi:predicted transcriptional regulator